MRTHSQSVQDQFDPRAQAYLSSAVHAAGPDLAAARERRIPVTNTPNVLTDECADLAIGLMLTSARQILFADRYVRDGSWATKGPIRRRLLEGAEPVRRMGASPCRRACSSGRARETSDAPAGGVKRRRRGCDDLQRPRTARAEKG